MSNSTIKKKTIDVPSDLFDKVMEYSHASKIYKFSPAVIKLIEQALEAYAVSVKSKEGTK